MLLVIIGVDHFVTLKSYILFDSQYKIFFEPTYVINNNIIMMVTDKQ